LPACCTNHNTSPPIHDSVIHRDLTATDVRRFTLSFDGTQQGAHGLDEPASSAASLLIIVTS